MTDIDQTKVFAVVGTPNMGYEIYMLEFVKYMEAEISLRYEAVEHIDIPMYPPRHRRRYMNMCRARNHWPRACHYRNRVLNRQMRLLQKKDCR
ncbi:MAG: hypothetical protein MJ165_00740 [Alphaproteobacteria bacterium]|nr:hypothetical protein [Alphaproteobacteria bacterium]